MLRHPTTSETAPAGKSAQPETRLYTAVGHRRSEDGSDKSRAIRGRATAMRPLDKELMNCGPEKLR